MIDVRTLPDQIRCVLGPENRQWTRVAHPREPGSGCALCLLRSAQCPGGRASLWRQANFGPRHECSGRDSRSASARSSRLAPPRLSKKANSMALDSRPARGAVNGRRLARIRAMVGESAGSGHRFLSCFKYALPLFSGSPAKVAAPATTRRPPQWRSRDMIAAWTRCRSLPRHELVADRHDGDAS
jgi:hypothetical protein